MTIKAHCMGMEFPKRVGLRDLVGLVRLPEGEDSVSYIRKLRDSEELPSAADLDAVAEEQKAKEQTSGGEK